MKIEPAMISDAERILELQKLAYESEAELYEDFTIPPMTQSINEIREEFATLKFLKITEDGRIIGSVRAYDKDGTCYIGRLMVHPEFQNRGIGTKLMNEVEKVFETSNRFELFTGSKSQKNISLYQNLGYRQFKTSTINDKVSLIYMEKTR